MPLTLPKCLSRSVRNARRQSIRQRRRTRSFETLERRNLLAVDDLASIAGTVFGDQTEDGLTADDVRLEGVTVSLFRDGGNGEFDAGAIDDSFLGDQSTDPSGNYRFINLNEGTYHVRQTTPAGWLTRPNSDVRTIVVTAADAAGFEGLLIDSYDETAQTVEAPSNGSTSSDSAKLAPEAIGGERDLFVELQSPSGRIELMANDVTPGRLEFAALSQSTGIRLVTWDGVDQDGAALDATGLDGIDVTGNGMLLGIRLVVGADQDNGLATLRIYTDAGNASEATIPIPRTSEGGADVTVFLPYADFQPIAGNGADLTDVGAIQLEIEGVAAVDGQIDDLGIVGPTVLTAEFPNLAPISLGDTVWQDDNNNGLRDDGEAGIASVTVHLYEDSDQNGELDTTLDALLDTQVTDALGNYRFDDLLPGDYLVQVDAANFAAQAPLGNLVTSTGNEPTPDPDDDVDEDDNGFAVDDMGVVSAAISLTVGGEPIEDGDQNPATNLSLDFGFAAIADVVIVKSDWPDPVVAGEDLTYTLDITNNGPSAVTGVTVTDTLPADVEYKSATSSQGDVNHEAGTVSATIGQLDSDASATVTIVVTVDPSAVGPLQNTAVVAGDQFDPILINNSDDEDTAVNRQVDLAIFKVDSPDPVVAGEQLTYALTVVNNGPSDATGVVATDTLPAGVTFQSATSSQGSVTNSAGTVTADLGGLAAGATATVTIQVAVDALTRGMLNNTATVTGEEPETDQSNNTDTEPTTVVTAVDLSITKTDSQDPVTAGDSLIYTLTASNQGPSDATGVTILDSLPPEVAFVSANSSRGTTDYADGTVTIDVGNLAVGETVTATVQVTVDGDMTGTITNEAVVSANETETNTGNNRAVEPTAVDALLSSIAGFVYLDRDNDGEMDADESPISGVRVALLGEDLDGHTVEREIMTNEDGSYRFDDLLAGTYEIHEDQPLGYGDGRETVGSVAAQTQDDAFTELELPPGTDAVDYLFGERARPGFSKRRFLSSR